MKRSRCCAVGWPFAWQQHDSSGKRAQHTQQGCPASNGCLHLPPPSALDQVIGQRSQTLFSLSLTYIFYTRKIQTTASPRNHVHWQSPLSSSRFQTMVPAISIRKRRGERERGKKKRRKKKNVRRRRQRRIKGNTLDSIATVVHSRRQTIGTPLRKTMHVSHCTAAQTSRTGTQMRRTYPEKLAEGQGKRTAIPGGFPGFPRLPTAFLPGRTTLHR